VVFFIKKFGYLKNKYYLCGIINQLLYLVMGQFSWITQDTNEAIRESYGCMDENLTTAYMHDNNGNVWEEKTYKGYGVFGGKDFFQLLAEMNNLEGLTGDVDNDRLLGIDLLYSGKEFLSPNLTRHKDWDWINEAPDNDPNQGWGESEDYESEDYLIK
jgi:hypothetical protein